ncbi:hypothetical protein LTR49_027337 [Elasticomyces elasticus]|nr:hypothetical protein LTR49_027337 [Elasticomyces elasticus]
MAGFARRSKATAPASRPGRSADSFRNTQGASRTRIQSVAAAALLQVAGTRTQDNDAERPKLRVSLDYGTKNLASAILRVEPGEPVSDDIQTVHFGVNGAGDFWAPQLVAWDTSGRFYWGHEVTRALDDRTLDPAAVIGLWKLLLYEDYATAEITTRVREQLGTCSLDDLLATHLEKILAAVKEWTKSGFKLDCRLHRCCTDIDAMPVELSLSVPQMWKAPANITMTMAAKCAGIKHVKLVYEPQSAAGYFAGNIKYKTPTYMGLDDVLLVADIELISAAVLALGFETLSANGTKVLFTTVGNPEGKFLTSTNFLRCS